MAKRSAMRLQFSTRLCDRCGGRRLAKSACPECGARPAVHETQPDLERRVRVVDEFRRLRRPVEPRHFPDDLDSRTATALNKASAALADVAHEVRSPEGLLDAFEVVDQLLADTSAPLLRPRLNWGRKIHRATGEATQALELFLDALAAPTMEAAQRLEREGNLLFKDAERALAESRSEKLSRAADEAGISQVLGQAHASLGSLSDSGILAQPEIVGEALGLPGSNLGIHFSIDALDVAAASMNEEIVHHLSDVTARLLSSAPQVLEWPGLLEELFSAGLLLDVRNHQMLSAIADEEDDLAVLENALAVASVVRERGYRACVRALLSAKGVLTLTETQNWNAGRVLKQGEDVLPELGLGRLDRLLRDAMGHQDFDLDDHTVVLKRGTVRLAVDELLDHLLAAVEVFVGMFRGILVAMAQAGIEPPARVELSLRHQQEALRYLLGRLGCTEVALHRSGDDLHVTTVGELDGTQLVSIAGAVATVASNEVNTLRMQLKSGSDIVRGSADLSTFREHDFTRIDGHPDDGILEFLELCAVTTVAGTNVLPESTWNDAAAHLGSDRGQEDSLAQRVRRVLRVRALAGTAGVNTEWMAKYLRHLRAG